MYLEIICMFCMFEKGEIIRFIFGTLDGEKRSYIDERQFEVGPRPDLRRSLVLLKLDSVID